MKYCRFESAAGPAYGLVEEVGGRALITRSIPAPLGETPERGALAAFAPLPLAEARLLPAVTPSKIVCVGRNYKAHADELGNQLPAEPLLFFKPPSALLAPGGTIRRPRV